MTVFHVGSISFWTPGWIYKLLYTNVKDDEMMCSAYVWLMSVQGQGHSLRLNIVWLYLVSALYLLNPWWYLQITLHECQLYLDNMQCLCLTKVSWRSSSQPKIKHCMTVFRVCSISFEPLVVFTNNFARISAILQLDDMHCLCLTKVSWRSRSEFKIKHCMTVFRVRSWSFEPLVGFTNNFPEMLAMMRRCAVPMFDKGRFKVKVKN